MGETVTVASKLPMKLQLQLCSSRTEERRDRSTTWKETVFFKTGKVVVINGTAFPNGDVPDDMDRPQMASGYALTPGVDKEFFDQWLEQNAKLPAVANGLIFAHSRMDSVKGLARENKQLDSMLGPLKHGGADGAINDPRMPKKLSAKQIRAGIMGGIGAEAASAE